MNTYIIKFPNGAYGCSDGAICRVEISDQRSEPYVERVKTLEEALELIWVWEYEPIGDLEALRKLAKMYLEQMGEDYRNWYNLCMGAEIVPASTLKCTQYDVYNPEGDYYQTYLSEKRAQRVIEDEDGWYIVVRPYMGESA